MDLMELNKDQTNYTRSTPKVQASSSDLTDKNRQHLFQRSALYHRDMWLNEKHKPFEEVSNPLTQNQSSDFFGLNICYGNSKLIQKMEDTMQELTQMKTEWLTHGIIHYDDKTWTISKFNEWLQLQIEKKNQWYVYFSNKGVVKKKSYTSEAEAQAAYAAVSSSDAKILFHQGAVKDKEKSGLTSITDAMTTQAQSEYKTEFNGEKISIVSYDKEKGNLKDLFQDQRHIKIENPIANPKEQESKEIRINQQTRTKYGFSLAEVTKINFTLSNYDDLENNVNSNWTPGQSLTLDLLSYPDDFDGALEQNILQVKFERVFDDSSINSITPCLITLLKRSQSEFFIMDPIAYSKNINFCQQYQASSDYGNKVGKTGEEKEIFTFQRDIEVQLGIVPIAIMNQSNAIQLLLQINGINVFSEILDFKILGVGKRQLYYTNFRSTQAIDLTQKISPKKPQTHGPFMVKNIRFFKARTFFVSGSVNANPPAFFKNDPWENHFRIYFSLLDACKQPSGYLFYPDNNIDWTQKIKIYLMESTNAMISHCNYEIPEQRIYDLNNSIILDHNQFYANFWCQKYNPGYNISNQDFEEIYVYLQITHSPEKPMFLENIPAPILIKNYIDIKDHIVQNDDLKDLYIIQIDNSDVNSGFIKRSAITNDIYQFRVRTLQPLISVEDNKQNIKYQSFLQTDSQRFAMSKMKKIDPATLDIKIISNTANFNFTSESIELSIAYKCTINSNKQDCFNNDPTKLKELQDDFIISFVPVSKDPYTVISQHFMSNKKFKINVIPQNYGQYDEKQIRTQVSSLFSNALIRRSRTGEIVDEIFVGEQIEIHIDLRNQLNESLPGQLLEQIYAQCNLHTESYYMVKDKNHKFEHYTTQEEELLKDIRFNSPGLNTVITASGIAQLFIMLNCPRDKDHFQIGCGRSDQILGQHNKGHQCQLNVKAHIKDKIYNNITVSVPLYPYDKIRLMNKVDNSLTYYKGDNLVFDVTVNDIYGNKINVPENELTFSASFTYSYTKVFNLEKFETMKFIMIYHEGVMSFQLSDADNIKFKTFPIRGGTTSYKINLNYSAACKTGEELKLLMPVKLISSDWIEPMNLVMPDQGDFVEGVMSTVVYDKIFQAGQPGRVYITLRNKKFQQLNEPIDLEQDLDVTLEEVGENYHKKIDQTLPDKKCSYIKKLGLYRGEIFVWITCKKSEMLYALIITYKKVILQPEKREFYVVQASNRYKIQFIKPQNLKPGDEILVNSSEYRFTQTATQQKDNENSSGTQLNFSITDSENNKVGSILMQRNDPQYGQMIYRIMNEDGTEADSKPIIFYGNNKTQSENNCQISINRMNVGKYKLIIEVPGDVDYTYDLVVKSDSQILSMNQRYLSFRSQRNLFKQGQFDENIAPYSKAFRVDDETWNPDTPAHDEGETISINDVKSGYKTQVYFVPRNIFNSTFPYDASGDDVESKYKKDQTNIEHNYQRNFISIHMTHLESGVKTQLELDIIESLKQTESAKYTIQVFKLTTDNNKVDFLNDGTIVQNGMYQVTAKSDDWLQGSLLIQGGTFKVKSKSETSWPSTKKNDDPNDLTNVWQYIKYNRMFIAKGPKKNLRQTYEPLPAYPYANKGYPPNNASPIECPYYDLTTDSILMFKTLLRDEFKMPFKKKQGEEFKVKLFEIKSKESKLKMGRTPQKTQFQTIYNEETGELTSFPKDGQAQLKTYDPRFYVVELIVDDLVKSSASQTKHLGLWTLAITDTSAQELGVNLQFFSPNFLQFQAGHPYTFLSELRQIQDEQQDADATTGNIDVKKYEKTLTIEKEIIGYGVIQEVEITQVTEHGRINYVSIYQNKAGIYKLEQKAQLKVSILDFQIIQKSTILLVTPGDPTYIHIITDVSKLQGFSVRKKISIVFELRDSYGNIIGPYFGKDSSFKRANEFEEWNRFFELQYTPEYVQTFLSFKHENERNDVNLGTERLGNEKSSQFVTHFTVFQEGNITIQSPLLPWLNDQKSKYSIKVVTDNSLNISPSFDKSFVQPTKNIITEGEDLSIQVIIKDSDGNLMDSQKLYSDKVGIVVNIVPIQSCNVSTYVTTDFDHQSKANSKPSVFLISSKKMKLKPCVYKIKVYWVRQNQQTQLSCSGCELVVEPNETNVKDVQFLDLLRKQTVAVDLYTSDYFRKIILLGQLQRHVIPVYQLDHSQNLIRKPTKLGTLNATISFSPSKYDYCKPSLQISRDPQSLLFMMELDWKSQALADTCVVSQNKPTITYWFENNPTDSHKISIEIVDDILSKEHLDYSVEKTNTISSVTTIVKLLNTVQNSLVVPSAIPSINQICMLKKQFPIIGVIDIRNEIGLRKDISLEDAKQMISINFGPYSNDNHDFTLYPGPEGNGTFLFTLYLDQLNQPGLNFIQKEAFIMINSTNKIITLVDFPISLHCMENKDVINTLVQLNGKNYTIGSDVKIEVGTPINITMQSLWETKVIDNYPADVVIESSQDEWNINSAPSDVVIESDNPSRVTYIFSKGVETTGDHRIILASSLPSSDTKYLFTAVQKSIISPSKSYFDVSIDESSKATGGNTKIYVHLRDIFKNNIAETNIDPSDFVISYSNTRMVMTGDYWILREEQLKKQQTILKDGCQEIKTAGIMECNYQLTIIGLWEFRVEYKGTRLKGFNQYALINQLGSIDYTKSLFLPMNFNIYEPYYKPQFGMSQFLKADVSDNEDRNDGGKFKQRIAFKVLLRDSYENPMLRQTKTNDISLKELMAQINPEVLDSSKINPITKKTYSPIRMSDSQYEYLQLSTKVMFDDSFSYYDYTDKTSYLLSYSKLAPMYVINSPNIFDAKGTTLNGMTNNIQIQVGYDLPNRNSADYVCSSCIIQNIYIQDDIQDRILKTSVRSVRFDHTVFGQSNLLLGQNNLIGDSQIIYIEVLTANGWSAENVNMMTNITIQQTGTEQVRYTQNTYENMIMIISKFDKLTDTDIRIDIVDPDKQNVKQLLTWKVSMHVLSFRVAKVTYDVVDYKAIHVKKYDKFDNLIAPQGYDKLFQIQLLFESLIADPDITYQTKDQTLTINALNGIYQEKFVKYFRILNSFGDVQNLTILNDDYYHISSAKSHFQIDKHFIRLNDKKETQNLTLSVYARNKYGVLLDFEIEQHFRIRQIYSPHSNTGTAMGNFEIIQNTYLESKSFDVTFQPVRIGNYVMKVFIDSLNGLSIVQNKENVLFSGTFVVLRSNQPMKDQKLIPKMFMESYYNYYQTNFNYQSINTIVYIYDVFGNWYDDELEPFINTTQALNNVLKVDGQNAAKLKPLMYALFRTDTDNLKSSKQFFLQLSNYKVDSLVSIKGKSEQISNQQLVQAKSTNNFDQYIQKFNSLFPSYVQKAIAKVPSFNWQNTTIVMQDNFSQKQELVLMDPKEIQLNFDHQNVEVRYAWISLSPNAIIDALGTEYDPSVMDINELNVPFNSDPIDQYKISPDSTKIQIIKLANNNIFRIRSEFKDDNFKGIEQTKKYSIEITIGAYNKTYKDINVIDHKRNDILQQLNLVMNKESIHWDSKLRLDFDFSSKFSTFDLELDLDLLKLMDIVVIRNRFTYLPRDQFRISKTIKEENSQKQWLLEVYMNGEPNDYQSLEVYYKQSDGQLFTLIEQGIVFFRLPSSISSEIENLGPDFYSDTELRIEFKDKLEKPEQKNQILFQHETQIMIYLFNKQHSICLPIDFNYLHYSSNTVLLNQIIGKEHLKNSFSVCTQFIEFSIFAQEPVQETLIMTYIDDSKNLNLKEQIYIKTTISPNNKLNVLDIFLYGDTQFYKEIEKEQFVSEGEVVYMYLYSTSFQKYRNQIDIEFLNNQFVFGRDYDMTYNYNEHSQLYIIMLKFGQHGVFNLGGLSINMQILDKYKGYTISIIESECKEIKLMQKHQLDEIVIGQNLTMIFSCLDFNGNPIFLEDQRPMGNYEALSFIIITNDTSLNFYSGRVKVFQKIPSLFIIQETMTIVGKYSLSIYFKNSHMKQHKLVHQIWDSISVVAGTCEDKTWHRCPNYPEICAPDYFACQMITKLGREQHLSTPFKCMKLDDVDPKPIYVKDPSECCIKDGTQTHVEDGSVVQKITHKWCQSQNDGEGKCIIKTEKCCDWQPKQNIRCASKSKAQGKEICVANQFECCEDMTFGGAAKTPLVKCTNENKCVSENSEKFCFEPFEVDCKEVMGNSNLETAKSKQTKYSQCKNDGRCRTDGNQWYVYYDNNDIQAQSYATEVEARAGYAAIDLSYAKIIYHSGAAVEQYGGNTSVIDENTSAIDAMKTLAFNEHPYQCANSYVCPLGYTMCPDGVCILGQNSFDACIKWSKRDKICELTMYDNVKINYVLCPGSYSQCAASYEECPSLVTCDNPDQVVCPNGACKISSSQCNFPDSSIIKNTTSFLCNDANLYKCPGINICAQRPELCPNSKIASYVPHKTCPINYHFCKGGKCSIDCRIQPEIDKNMNPTEIASNKNNDNVVETDGKLFGNEINNYLVKCPQTNELRAQISDCPSQKLCASNWRFHYGPLQKKLCQGIQKCVDDLDECDYSFCENPFVISFSQNLTGQSYTICHDGKCAYSKQNLIGVSPDICMTPFSCSDHYFKVDTSVGEFCFDQKTMSRNDSNNNIVDQINFIAHMFNQYKCDPEQIKCLSGVCVRDISKCPTAITCPYKTHPHRCQDGQCVKHLNLCSNIDNQVLQQLNRCTSFGLLLCQSDLRSCVSSLDKCPKSNSLTGYCRQFQIMCWDGSCEYDISQCPPLHKNYLSSCHSHKSLNSDKFLFRDPIGYVQCPSTGQCVQYLNNCSDPSILIQYWPKKYDLDFMQSHNNQAPIQCKYQCKDGCLDQPCPEWFTCPNGLHDISLRCWNGECVNALYQCMKIQDGKGCLYEDQFCYNDYRIECLNAYPNFIDGKIQTIDNCYTPQCPPNKSFKCPNGLCVKDLLNCAAVPFSMEDIEKCYTYNSQLKSKFGNINRFVPCGNGKCVSEASQCLPLVDCEDIDPSLKVRCTYDATCNKTEFDCTHPKVQNQDGSRQQFCPNHIPYLCNSGECVKDQTYCTLWYNGCSQGRPHKCPFSGLCVRFLSECSDIPVSTQVKSQINDLIKIQKKVQQPIIKQVQEAIGEYFIESEINFCKKNQFLCNVNHGVEQYHCVDNLSECVNYKTGCQVDKPIKCGNPAKCYRDLKDCKTAHITDPVGQLPSNRILSNGCPINNLTRCNWVDDKNFMCKKVPYIMDDYITNQEFKDMYSCFPSLYQNKQSEMARNNPQFKNQLVNICQSQKYPISCQSGECVSDINQCKTCKAGCSNSINHQCVADQDSCSKVEFASITLQVFTQPTKYCPENQPVMCINDGKCVGSAFNCAATKTDLNSLRDSRFEFINPLISSKCNSYKPIRCATGNCAVNSNDCINDIRYQTIVDENGNHSPNDQFKKALLKPKPILLLQYSTAVIHYVSQNSYVFTVKQNPCAVICQDGSCRDDQLNCPQIQACPSPMIIDHNNKCHNGLCQNENSCKIIDTCGSGLTQRCEDGSCRESCLEFFGCPIDTPYMCQDGNCGSNKLDCFDLTCRMHHLEEDKDIDNQVGNKTRCRNGDCIINDTGFLCPQAIPLYQYQVKQIQYSLNVLLNNTVEFLYDLDKNVIGELIVPSGAMPVTQTQNDAKTMNNYHKNHKNYIQRIVITGIPDSVLKDMKNIISKDRVEPFEITNQVGKDDVLPQKYSLLAPVIRIQNLDEKVQDSDKDGWVKRTNMAQAVYLKFKIDVDHFPKDYDHSRDSCLGIKQDNLWLCIGRDTNHTLTSYDDVSNSTMITYPIYQPGIYAFIINPQPKGSGVTSMIEFIILRNTKMVFLLGSISIIFVLIMLVCGVFILYEKERQYKQQHDIDHDLRGEKHSSFVKELLAKSAGIDKMKLIENLIKRIKKTETQRSNIKTSRKKIDQKCKQQLIKQQQMIDRIKKMKAQAANNKSIDIEDEFLNDDYLDDTISAYDISINVKKKHLRHGMESSIGIDGTQNLDNNSNEEDGIDHYDQDEEEEKVDMYKLAKQYTKSVNDQFYPTKGKVQKKSVDILTLQKKALLTSISNFQKQVGVEKRDSKVVRQSINKKLGLQETKQVKISDSVDKKKKFFKVRIDPSDLPMNTKQLMERANDDVLDRYLDKIDIHNSLMQGSILDDPKSSDSGEESEVSSLEEIKEEGH